MMRWVFIVLLGILFGAWEVTQPSASLLGLSMHLLLPTFIAGLMFFPESKMLVYAISAGLVVDVYSGGLPDIATLRFALVIFIISRLAEQTLTKRSLRSVSLLFLAAYILNELLSFLLRHLMQWSGTFPNLWMGEPWHWSQALVDMGVTLVLFAIGRKLGLSHHLAESGTLARYARTQDLF